MAESKELIKVETKNWDEALENEDWREPFANIFETDDDYVLIVDLPGVAKENVKIKVENASLLIMGRIDYHNAVSQNYILRESSVSNFYRKFNLMDSIEIEKIDAELKDGQLKVTLPKHERVKPRVINIK